MLVLSRRPGEEILIGDEVRITVLKINGGCVKIGIEAPKCIPIRRKEIVMQEPQGDVWREEMALPAICR